MTPVKIVIVFYSRNGNTEALANGIAEGARAEGAEVSIRRVPEIVSPDIIARVPGWAENRDRMQALYPAPTQEELMEADAILFGSPTRFGNVSAELKAYIDSLGGLWAKGALNGKAGGGFTSTATMHGGNESTIVSMYNFMAHLGLIIVPTGYSDPALFAAGTPYGASSVSGGSNDAPPTEADLTVAQVQGRRTAQVARALKQA